MDFGASQPYDDAFIDMYKRLLLSAVDGRREDCIALSREIGYLTDNDNEVSYILGCSANPFGPCAISSTKPGR